MFFLPPILNSAAAGAVSAMNGENSDQKKTAIEAKKTAIVFLLMDIAFIIFITVIMKFSLFMRLIKNIRDEGFFIAIFSLETVLCAAIIFIALLMAYGAWENWVTYKEKTEAAKKNQ